MIHRLLKPHRLCTRPIYIILILLLMGFIYYTGLPTHILTGDSALNEDAPRIKLLIDKKRYHPDHDPVWIQRHDASPNETMDNFTKEDISYNGSVPILTLFATFDTHALPQIEAFSNVAFAPSGGLGDKGRCTLKM